MLVTEESWSLCSAEAASGHATTPAPIWPRSPSMLDAGRLGQEQLKSVVEERLWEAGETAQRVDLKPLVLRSEASITA